MNIDFQYINTQVELDKCYSILKTRNALALDLEFDKNRYAYGFNLSMLQINDGEKIYLIDALNELDLSLFFELFQSDLIQKIVFAFGEDIRLLHSLNCFPKNVFDLDTCSKLLNFDPCSLSKLTHLVLSEKEEASSQKSNWLKRPLSEAQLVYAAEDVRHLFRLKENLEVLIEERGVTTWLAQENSKYDNQDFSGVQSFSPIKTKDKKGLTQYQLYVFELLMDLRERIAEENNFPGYKIVSKDVLLDLANDSLKFKDIFKVRGISKYFTSSNSIHNILSASEAKALELGISKTKPAIPKLDREEFLQMQEKKKRSDKIITTILEPIKDLVKNRYGENTSTFVFSNKIMKDISSGNLGLQPPYKQRLIWEYSKELGIDLELLS